MLIDAEIMAKNRNSRWRPSAILDFRKTDFSQIGCLRVLFFHLSTKFGTKMLIDAEIMAKNLNLRWRPSAILDFRKTDFWQIGCLGVSIFHLWTKFGAKMLIGAQIIAKKSKFKMAAVRHLGILISPYRTTHVVFSLGYISLSAKTLTTWL